MLYIAREMRQLDETKLMALYEESHRKAGAREYSMEAPDRQLLLTEADSADYLRQVFFSQPGASCCIWLEENQYLSALRLEPYQDGLLITALETHPLRRSQGFGKSLLQAVQATVAEESDLPLYSHIHKKNLPSQQLHRTCGFQVQLPYARYISGETSRSAETWVWKPASLPPEKIF